MNFSALPTTTQSNGIDTLLTLQGGNALQVPVNQIVSKPLTANGDMCLGSGAPVVGAVAGFPYIPTVAGQPTGVPVGNAGYTPLVFDVTHGKLWAFYAVSGTSAWHYLTFT